jgi:hypothetical protein
MSCRFSAGVDRAVTQRPRLLAETGPTWASLLCLSRVRTALGNNAIALAAIGKSASQFFAEVVGKSQIDAAGFIEGLHLLG